MKPAEAEPAKADVAVPAAEPRAVGDDEIKDGDLAAADADALDGSEPANKGKLEKAKPIKAGAIPFGEQIRAAKVARDPLLAKILGDKGPRAGAPRV